MSMTLAEAKAVADKAEAHDRETITAAIHCIEAVHFAHHLRACRRPIADNLWPYFAGASMRTAYRLARLNAAEIAARRHEETMRTAGFRQSLAEGKFLKIMQEARAARILVDDIARAFAACDEELDEFDRGMFGAQGEAGEVYRGHMEWAGELVRIATQYARERMPTLPEIAPGEHIERWRGHGEATKRGIREAREAREKMRAQQSRGRA